jgi:hypothetical protein
MLELDIPIETIFLEFGKGKNGVQGADFLLKNPAGRVPLIYDPNTGLYNLLDVANTTLTESKGHHWPNPMRLPSTLPTTTIKQEVWPWTLSLRNILSISG